MSDIFEMESTTTLELENQTLIPFTQNEQLSLGVEVEFQLIDSNTLDLAHKGEEILNAAIDNPNFKQEFYLSTIEVNTNICDSVQHVEEDLQQSFNYLRYLGKRYDLLFATTGCHPFANYHNCIISPTKRYYELIDRNQWLARRTTVYGLHVHIGMKSGDDCIRFNNFFMHLLPHLLALSCSSPFWQGYDTGLSACRPTTYEALPTAGQPYCVQNWLEFENLCAALTKCSAIKSLKDLWWDIRPNPTFGTLEIRICDGLATLSETVAIIAFIHLLAHWFRDNGDWIDQVQLPTHWISRENKWRVIRFGLDAEIITSNNGTLSPMREEIEKWLLKLEPYAAQFKYEKYMALLSEILLKGTSTTRQRHIYHQTHSLEDVVAHNIHEFQTGVPLW